MKTLNMRRMGYLITWSIYNERGKLIKNSVAVIAVFFVIMAVDIWSARESADADLAYYRAAVGCLCGAQGVLFVLLTHIFANLKTKEDRIMFFMLPASVQEKFLVRLFYVAVLAPVLILLAFIAADVLATIFAQALSCDYVMAGCANVVKIFADKRPNLADPQTPLMCYCLLSLYLMGDAFVLLCSTIFRKATLMSIVCSLVLFFIVVTAPWWDGFEHFLFTHDEGEIKAFFTLAGSLCYLIALGELWLSYVVFRRMQVVPGRFVNL